MEKQTLEKLEAAFEAVEKDLSGRMTELALKSTARPWRSKRNRLPRGGMGGVRVTTGHTRAPQAGCPKNRRPAVSTCAGFSETYETSLRDLQGRHGWTSRAMTGNA
jgi:hypothetical protein